jgi:hypothetical protein
MHFDLVVNFHSRTISTNWIYNFTKLSKGKTIELSQAIYIHFMCPANLLIEVN